MMIRIIQKLRVIFIRLLLPGSIYHIYSVISDKSPVINENKCAINKLLIILCKLGHSLSFVKGIFLKTSSENNVAENVTLQKIASAQIKIIFIAGL